MGHNKKTAAADGNLRERRRNVDKEINPSSQYSNDKKNNENNKTKADKTNAARGKKSHQPTKEFKIQNSYLTEAYQNSFDVRGVRHLCYVVLPFWIMRLIIKDYSSNKPFQIPGVPTLLEACQGFHFWVLSHIIFLILSVITYVAFRCWGWIRSQLNTAVRKLFDYICITILITCFTAVLIIPMWIVATYDLGLGPLTKEFIVGEQVRILMKLIAFLSTKIPEALNVPENKTKKDPQKQSTTPSLSKLIYFLYAPTLVYSDEYPRNDKIRWRFAAAHLAELIIILYAGTVIFERELKPAALAYVLRHEPPNFLLLVVQCALPFVVMLFTGIHALWHSMQNCFAEILRFGDRKFYADWWNVGTPAAFHRANNIVVQDWLFYYLYYPVRKLSGSRVAAQVTVLLISGLVHDIMLGAALGFGLPIVLSHFVVLAVLVVYSSKERERDALSNYMHLFCFPYGASFMGCFLLAEYLARQSCEQVIDSSWDIFYPRVFNCTLKSGLQF